MIYVFRVDKLLLADAFENFRNKCVEIYELDQAHFLSAPGLTWQTCLRKDKCKIRTINWYWYVVNGWNR